MVLAYQMKRIIYIMFGIFSLGFIAFLIASAISQYQVRILLYNPDQSGVFVDWFLIIWPIFFAIGGWLGNWFYRQRGKAQLVSRIRSVSDNPP